MEVQFASSMRNYFGWGFWLGFLKRSQMKTLYKSAPFSAGSLLFLHIAQSSYLKHQLKAATLPANWAPQHRTTCLESPLGFDLSQVKEARSDWVAPIRTP